MTCTALGLKENNFFALAMFESFDNLECINQVEEFETLLNLDKRGLKHEW